MKKSENENETNEYRDVLESNFDGMNWLFVLIYLNRDNYVKHLKLEDIIYQKA